MKRISSVFALAWWAVVVASIVNSGPLVAALIAAVSLVAAGLALSYLTEPVATRAPVVNDEGPTVDPAGAHPLTVGELAACLDGLDVDVPVHLHVRLDSETGVRMAHIHVVTQGSFSNPSCLVLAARSPLAHG